MTGIVTRVWLSVGAQKNIDPGKENELAGASEGKNLVRANYIHTYKRRKTFGAHERKDFLQAKPSFGSSQGKDLVCARECRFGARKSKTLTISG